MPIYEFRCSAGHVTEALVQIGTGAVPCGQCPPRILWKGSTAPVYAHRILSPTRTDFHFADTRRRYRNAFRELKD